MGALGTSNDINYNYYYLNAAAGTDNNVASISTTTLYQLPLPLIPLLLSIISA
jgi:hypothetical protein